MIGRWIRELAFDKSGQPALGVRRGDEVVDLAAAAPDLPGDLPGLLAGGTDAMDRAKSAAEAATGDAVMSGEGLVYHPTIWIQQIICVGLNYAAHAAEAQSDTSTAGAPFSVLARRDHARRS